MVQTILKTFSSRLFITLFNFLIVLGISRTLGPDGKGQATLIITSIFVILFFCNVMSGQALIYLIPRYRPSSLMMPAYLWCLAISLLALCLMVVTPWLNHEFVPHIFGLSLIQGLLHTHLMVLAGKQRIQLHNLFNVLQGALTVLGVAISFYVVGFRSIFAYIYSLYGSFSIVFLLSIAAVWRYWEGISCQRLKDIVGKSFHFGGHFQLYEIMQLLNFRFGFYVLEAWHGETALGIYSIGVSLLEAVWLFGRSVALVQYARIANNKDTQFIRLMTLRLVKVSFLMSLFGILALLVIPSEVYTFVFGEAFAPIKDYMKWLMPGTLVYSIALAISNYYAGLGKYRVNILGSFLGLICTLSLSYILIPRFALSGTGLTASISFTVTTLFLLWHFQQNARFAWQDYVPQWADIKLLKDEVQKALSTGGGR